MPRVEKWEARRVFTHFATVLSGRRGQGYLWSTGLEAVVCSRPPSYNGRRAGSSEYAPWFTRLQLASCPSCTARATSPPPFLLEAECGDETFHAAQRGPREPARCVPP